MKKKSLALSTFLFISYIISINLFNFTFSGMYNKYVHIIKDAKGAFFRKRDSFFESPNLPISPKKYSKKTILSLKSEISTHISKQLIQISSSG